MYWLPSNIFSFLQTATLKMPAVKKLVGIPEVPKHIAAANAASTGGAANMFESFIPKQEEDPAAKLAMDKVQVRLNLFFPCSFPSS